MEGGAASDLAVIARAACDSQSLVFVRKVGGGAFKDTFEVCPSSGPRRAMKVFKPGFFTERATRELEAMVRCDHPNIGKLSSVHTFTWEGHSYLICIEELIAGGTLTAYLERHPHLTRIECQRLGERLIDAVGHIASLKLVHRDLKPDNILLRHGISSPVVVDFGIVRNLDDTSLTPTWAMQGPGTPLFASPEQLNNEKDLVDWRSDQFSLGVVLSAAAFGFHPYAQEGDPAQTVVARVSQRLLRSQRFVDATRTSGLKTLLPMTAPWPVERIRTPELLAASWAVQGETN